MIYHNGSSYTFTWTQGRRLATAVKGSTTASFTYNESGIRTSKTVNGVTHEYVVDGTKIISDCWFESTVRHYIAYIYDAKGVIGMAYRNSSMSAGVFEYYIFEKNLQGDIVAVYDEYRNAVVKYTYDAWGNVTETLYDTTSNGQYNSFRYRGYFYDEDTELYYLNSRYYDPATGRFINADSIGLLGANRDFESFNLYVYCGDNPIKGIDPLGYAWYDVAWDWVNTITGLCNGVSTVTALGSLAVAALNGRWSDIASDWNNGCLNPFNTSESTALKSTVVGFYKGSTVVRQNAVGTCSILGTIWAESDISSTTLKHEYGHSVQERLMGPSYLTKVALPSGLYYLYDAETNGSSLDYYSMPWERTAEWFGGVQRETGYKKGSLGWGIAENILGPVVIPIYLIFGFNQEKK